MKICNLFLIFFVICLCSCYKKNKLNIPIHTKQSNTEKKITHKLAFVDVDEVECEFCANAVLNQLRSLDGVVNADYEFDDDKYNSRIKIVYNDSYELKKDTIENALSKEDFTLKSFESV